MGEEENDAENERSRELEQKTTSFVRRLLDADYEKSREETRKAWRPRETSIANGVEVDERKRRTFIEYADLSDDAKEAFHKGHVSMLRSAKRKAQKDPDNEEARYNYLRLKNRPKYWEIEGELKTGHYIKVAIMRDTQGLSDSEIEDELKKEAKEKARLKRLAEDP